MPETKTLRRRQWDTVQDLPPALRAALTKTRDRLQVEDARVEAAVVLALRGATLREDAALEAEVLRAVRNARARQGVVTLTSALLREVPELSNSGARRAVELASGYCTSYVKAVLAARRSA